MKTLVVIPARYESTRLPGKPLVDLAGVPMVERTWRQCAAAVPSDQIVVATEDERIVSHCERVGIQVLMTSRSCLTGTDRVAEVASTITADLYVNVQGDEPLCNPDDILALIEAAQHFPGQVLNGMCPIVEEEQFRSSSVPKVVARPDGRMLYMSRAAIPTTKSGGFLGAHRQVCIYGFPPDALAAFASRASKTPLEQIEDIEILRLVEMGYDIQMVPMSDQSVAVDNPEDVAKVVAILNGVALDS